MVTKRSGGGTYRRRKYATVLPSGKTIWVISMPKYRLFSAKGLAAAAFDARINCTESLMEYLGGQAGRASPTRPAPLNAPSVADRPGRGFRLYGQNPGHRRSTRASPSSPWRE